MTEQPHTQTTTRLFLQYVICAGLATIVDFSLLFVLTEYASLHYLLSALYAYAGGMLVNYILNKFFNFKNKSNRIILQFGVFAGVALIGLCLNQILLWFFVEYGKIWYITAKFFTVGVVMLWSFYGHKKLTFTLFT